MRMSSLQIQEPPPARRAGAISSRSNHRGREGKGREGGGDKGGAVAGVGVAASEIGWWASLPEWQAVAAVRGGHLTSASLSLSPLFKTILVWICKGMILLMV
jgi:hypothetical protein